MNGYLLTGARSPRHRLTAPVTDKREADQQVEGVTPKLSLNRTGEIFGGCREQPSNKALERERGR
jgi:hypothetical protein